jgi:hypothetical protein
MTTLRSLTRAAFLGGLLAASLAILLPARASAHAPKPRHGGAIVLAGSYHVELVIKDGQVDIYLTDHNDKPVAATGRKGVAILTAGDKSVRVPLEPIGAERLTGKSAEALSAAAKGVVQIVEPTGATVQARFQ